MSDKAAAAARVEVERLRKESAEQLKAVNEAADKMHDQIHQLEHDLAAANFTISTQTHTIEKKQETSERSESHRNDLMAQVTKLSQENAELMGQLAAAKSTADVHRKEAQDHAEAARFHEQDAAVAKLSVGTISSPRSPPVSYLLPLLL